MATKKVTQRELTDIEESLGLPKASVKEATLAVFQSAPEKEFKTDEVWLAVHQVLPKVKKDTVLWQITELKKAGMVRRVRNDGRYQVLKLKPPKVLKITSPQVVDPMSAIKQLTGLVQQRAILDAEIARLKNLIV
jgi:Fe2+ or Zn2+ uptake regulation protein